jgi:hypothetical protein
MKAARQACPVARPGASASVEEGSSDSLCVCCEPQNPLVMRPDLGVLADGSPEYALCVLHEPEPMVYRNRGDGIYLQAKKLSFNPAGEIVDESGAVMAKVGSSDFQRLSTVDDDEPSPGSQSGGAVTGSASGRVSQPQAVHVDLSQDDFYGLRS